ncbi:OprD family outer membrane porin [Marinobacterium stanieri]|uniref:Outer membrane porin, OprD family n=1 Tax=Marinobacterium stanieri TaxID=49186 RepID=A0A1N6VFN4_9GAMM|nr:OprD family outer membrane porin [Marinobacterium stanieri]SIQ76466.1 outer membrane porin, OprD family [Marinobacterium stanieri]
MKKKNYLYWGALALAAPVLASASDFIDQSETSIRYAQYYWDEDPDKGFGPTRDEWVHAIQATFKSGYFADRVGLDLSAALAGDLNVGGEANSLTNLSPNTSIQDPHGIGKLTEAYLRFQPLGADNTGLKLGIGKKVRSRTQYADNTTRILPASTTGADLDYAFKHGSVYFTQIEGFSPRNTSASSNSLENFNGDKIDHLRILGTNLKLPFNISANLEHAESKDYLKSSFASLSKSFTLNNDAKIQLHFKYGNQQDAGDLFETTGAGPYAAESDHDATFYELGGKYSQGPYYLGAHVTKTRGDDYDRVFFAEDYGHWSSAAKNFYWFGLEDEQMIKLSGGMSFADLGIPQLRWDAHYAWSDDAAGFNDFERTELQSVLQYRFDGALKGLHLAWLHVEHDTEGTPDGVRRTSLPFTPAGIITHHADRIYLNYTVKF